MDSEFDQQQMSQDKFGDGEMADPDPNFEGESAIDMEGLTESEMHALQKQTQAELDGGIALVDNDASGIELDGEGELGLMEGEDNGSPSGIELEADGQGEGEEEDEDVIDVDNPDDLARKGLRKIQIEGDDE